MYTRTTGCLHRSCPSGVLAIAAGYSHSLVLKRDGTVWATGYNYYGQLGDGTNTNKNTFGKCTGMAGR